MFGHFIITYAETLYFVDPYASINCMVCTYFLTCKIGWIDWDKLSWNLNDILNHLRIECRRKNEINMEGNAQKKIPLLQCCEHQSIGTASVRSVWVWLDSARLSSTGFGSITCNWEIISLAKPWAFCNRYKYPREWKKVAEHNVKIK